MVETNKENAYDRLLDEINSFLIADYDLLRKMLFICKKDPKCKLNELNANEIEIKYNPNMSDNMLSKAQAYQFFYKCGVPSRLIVEWCRLSNDPVTASKMIDEYKNKLATETVEDAQKDIGNNSQE